MKTKIILGILFLSYATAYSQITTKKIDEKNYKIFNLNTPDSTISVLKSINEFAFIDNGYNVGLEWFKKYTIDNVNKVEVISMEVFDANVYINEKIYVKIVMKTNGENHNISRGFSFEIYDLVNNIFIGTYHYFIHPIGIAGSTEFVLELPITFTSIGEHNLVCKIKTFIPSKLKWMENNFRGRATFNNQTLIDNTSIIEKKITVKKRNIICNVFNEADFLTHFNRTVWTKKGDSYAIEYNRCNHNYRTYEPIVSVINIQGENYEGLHIYFKIDHIRGGHKDDHAIVDLKTNKNGYLTEASVEIRIAGEEAFTEFADIASTGLSSTGNQYALAAAVALQLSAALYDLISDLTDNGGSNLLGSIVYENINAVISSINCH